jgi:hypothetical protein
MRLHSLALAFVAGLVTVAVGAGTPPATADATCPQTKAVFYTTDTQVLARTLRANPSDCADYYISISPVLPSGEPRGNPNPALGTVHAQGPRFHALAEVRPKQWAPYAATTSWYAAGVKFHDDMLMVGFDPAAGDTWALNEVGSPSDPINTDVFNGVDGARQNLRDFVRGLYNGSSGPPLPGLVFAADAAQLAPNVADYAQKLAAWYADAPFWEDMQRYVSTWAQETYADARAWGVAGSPLAERTSYLDDYFLHGLRVAEQGNDATAAARAFLDQAYIPLANASYRYAPANPVTVIAFGYTDIGAVGMQRFISAQTYALRSTFGTRLGFAVVPANDGTDRPAIEGRVAAVIHDSQSDSMGACTAAGESCDFDVPGAAFTQSWKALANTQEGGGVAVQLGAGVSVTFADVSARGATWFSSSPTADAPLGWVAAGPTYAIATTAATTGPIQICLGAGTGHVFRRSVDGWLDITTSPGCGTTDALGTFALFFDPTPPVVVPHIDGPLGNDGWYVGDVTVSWDVSDPQTSVSKDGCDTVIVAADTAGTTFTCIATSEGGATSEEVTVKRDATPPALTCTPTPSTLWPPNGKLVPVNVAVDAADATSGPDGFLLTDALTTDAADFVTGTPDVTGLLRAKRSGNGDGRTYALVYTGFDAAGNSAPCTAEVVVPHDQRNQNQEG